jgi:hypothetical protein
MYTIKELIETLKQCPEDSEVEIIKGSCGYRISHTYEIKTVGINNNEKSVDLFID